jgi:hypothetical protein
MQHKGCLFTIQRCWILERNNVHACSQLRNFLQAQVIVIQQDSGYRTHEKGNTGMIKGFEE